MTRFQKQMMVMIAVVVFCSFSVQAAEVNRIGIVDLQRIFQNSEGGKKAEAEIKAQHEKMVASLNSRGAEIEELKKRLEREALVMDKAMREEKEREYRIKVGDLKALEQKYSDDIKAIEAKIVGRLQDEVVRLVEKIGKQDGYLLIIEKRTAGVMYAPNSIDITDQLIPQITADVLKLD